MSSAKLMSAIDELSQISPGSVKRLAVGPLGLIQMCSAEEEEDFLKILKSLIQPHLEYEDWHLDLAHVSAGLPLIGLLFNMFDDDDSWIQSDEEDHFPKTCPDLLWNDLIQSSQKSGWLKKMSRGIIKKNLLQRWSYRFFALNSHKLFLFKSPESKFPCGVIDFDQVQIFLTREENKLILNPSNGANLMTLRLYDESELNLWQECILSVISRSKGTQEGKIALGKKQKFWKFERICEFDFLEAADTGDLLLIRSETLASKISRTFIKTHDRIALILKYVNGKVALFEKNQSGKTEILLWDDFLKDSSISSTLNIFWRRLNVEKTDEMMIQLEEFVQNTRTQDYSSNLNPALQSEKVKLDVSLSFSADLISEAYKEMGILSKEFSQKQYIPEDFSKNKDLIFEQGASLDRELLIDFDID
jgi:hypothetical protein